MAEMVKTIDKMKSYSNLEVSEEKNIKNTLIFLRNAKVNLESYETKILSEENIENIFRFQIAYDGENRLLKYDVSNTISLEEYLKTYKLKKNDICDILLAIDEILTSVENYLISENSIALDLKLIRVSRNNKNNIAFKFIAIPNYNTDFSYELSKLLIRILRHIDLDDKEAMSLAYGLFVRSSKDNYTMNDLIELVDKVRDKNTKLDDDITLEDLINYDEELAKEIQEEELLVSDSNIIDDSKINNDFKTNDIGNRADVSILDDIDDIDDIDDPGDVNSVSMDKETKAMLEESLYNDFNKDDKKIIKIKKSPFGLKQKKALKGHIKVATNVGFLGYIIAPILVLLIPFAYFFING